MTGTTLALDGSIWAAVITLAGSIIGGALIMAWRLGTLATKVDEHGKDLVDVTHTQERMMTRLEVLERQMMEQGRILGGRRRTDPKWPGESTP